MKLYTHAFTAKTQMHNAAHIKEKNNSWKIAATKQVCIDTDLRWHGFASKRIESRLKGLHRKFCSL